MIIKSKKRKNILIKGGTVIDPANGIHKKTTVAIEKGKIIAIGRPPKGFEPEITIDAKNQLILPGLIDLCARLREPGPDEARRPRLRPRPSRSPGKICGEGVD